MTYLTHIAVFCILAFAVTGWAFALDQSTKLPRTSHLELGIFVIPKIAISLGKNAPEYVPIAKESTGPQKLGPVVYVLPLQFRQSCIRFLGNVMTGILFRVKFNYGLRNVISPWIVLIYSRVDWIPSAVSNLKFSMMSVNSSHRLSHISYPIIELRLLHSANAFESVDFQNSLFGIHQGIRASLSSLNAISSQFRLINEDSNSYKPTDDPNDGKQQIESIEVVGSWIVVGLFFLLACWGFFIAAPHKLANGKDCGAAIVIFAAVLSLLTCGCMAEWIMK
jgi:hypothetical protein